MDWPVDVYRRKFRRFVINYEKKWFDFLVKFYWLTLQFKYNGLPRSFKPQLGIAPDRAYGIFMRHYVGVDNRLFTQDGVSEKVLSYIREWYPDLAERNPFKEKIKYPYRYMTFECLVVVAYLPERLEILERGEKNKMKYTRFLDYVLNYVNCYNDDHGYVEKYVFKMTHKYFNNIPVVTINKDVKII